MTKPTLAPVPATIPVDIVQFDDRPEGLLALSGWRLNIVPHPSFQANAQYLNGIALSWDGQQDVPILFGITVDNPYPNGFDEDCELWAEHQAGGGWGFYDAFGPMMDGVTLATFIRDLVIKRKPPALPAELNITRLITVARLANSKKVVFIGTPQVSTEPRLAEHYKKHPKVDASPEVWSAYINRIPTPIFGNHFPCNELAS
ncbi:MAG: hypothetical protein WAX89_01485 [Alphaproteobacteria bacterium]